MADQAPKRLAMFSPEVAQEIYDFVSDMLRQTKPRGNDPINRRWPSTKFCFAKVTDHHTADGIVYHAWSEMRWDFTKLQWSLVPDGRTGTVSSNALIALDPATQIANETIVLAGRQEDSDSGKNVWVGMTGGGADSKGTKKGQLHQMTSDNGDGWDFLLVHG